VTNALNQTTTIDYYSTTGLLRKITDPNQLATEYKYDSFGRIITITHPDQTRTTWDYKNCSDLECYGAQHKTTIVMTNSSAIATLNDRYLYLDKFDRPLVSRIQFPADYQWTETTYDARGLVRKTSIPCLTDAPAVSCASAWSEYTYDAIGRPIVAKRPDSSGQLLSTIIEYFGFKTTITDPLTSKTSRLIDPFGLLRSSTDEKGTQTFTYDSAGSLLSVTNSSTTLFEATYDYGLSAFQVSAKSYAQSSSTQYRYDGLGQLRRWIDPKGQRFEMKFDPLSRPVERRDGIVSANAEEALTSWIWGQAQSAHNIGRLATVRISSAEGTYQETYGYDGAGRLSNQNIMLPGDSTGYAYDFAYNPDTGLLDTLTYPVSTSLYRFALKYNAPNGILLDIRDANSPSTVYWQLDKNSDVPGMNALGRVAREWLGGTISRKRDFNAMTGDLVKVRAGTSTNETSLQNASFTYDSIGNLVLRQNSLGSLPSALAEDFTNANDPLYRMQTAIAKANGTPTSTLSVPLYDELGNIKHVDVVGANVAPVDQTITWTSYNYPKTITAPWQHESVSFSYGPDRNRYRMTYTAGSDTETTYYLGGLMEKVTTPSGATEFRHYIPGPEDIIGIHTRSGSTPVTRYLLTDHLGSIDTIADSTGAKIVGESFTAYGMPRDPTTWSGTPSSTADSITRQGFTFQTVLGHLGLNHMNGRVQDAITGTFLSPDVLVSDPTNTQSFNRYAYVNNNPMTYTDPSGFDAFNPRSPDGPDVPKGCTGCIWGMLDGLPIEFPMGFEGWGIYDGFKGWAYNNGGPNTHHFNCYQSGEACWRAWKQGL